jgi:hypothetical protein
MRKKLAELVVAEILTQLDAPTFDNAVDELCELGLFAYVKPYLPSAEGAGGA